MKKGGSNARYSLVTRCAARRGGRAHADARHLERKTSTRPFMGAPPARGFSFLTRRHVDDLHPMCGRFNQEDGFDDDRISAAKT